MTIPPSRNNGHPASRLSGFTLVELLIVMAIIVLMTALAVPAFNALKGGSDLTKAAYDIQGALQLARTYAVSNHTYTWVGFFEEDSNNYVSPVGAAAAQAGIGHLTICIAASADGTPIYNAASLATSTSLPFILNQTSSSLIQVGNLLKFTNIHVFDPTKTFDAATSGSSPAPGSFAARPGKEFVDGFSPAVDRVGMSGNQSSVMLEYYYPLALTTTGSAVYTFGAAQQAQGQTSCNGIVQFNPQGEAISETGPVPGVHPCKEIAIEATHGSIPSAAANIFAIDINGLTGKSTIYRQ